MRREGEKTRQWRCGEPKTDRGQDWGRLERDLALRRW
jgi:hypothetical protein